MNIKYLSTSTLLFFSTAFFTFSHAIDNADKNDSSFSEHFIVELVTENIYVIQGSKEGPSPINKGFINNPGFVIADSGVIVIDPGSRNEVGEIVLKRISQITSLPVIAIFNTHEHGDHWLANQAILDTYPDIPIYAHPNMIESINNGIGKHWLNLMGQLTESPLDNTSIKAPTHQVHNNEEIVIDNLTFKIHHYGNSHTNNDIMIEVVELDTIFLGDNVLNKRMPHLDDGDIVSNISTINEILKLDIKYFIPGHGAPGIKTIAEEYLEYLTLLHKSVEHYYHEGKLAFEMKGPIEDSMEKFSGWIDFDKELGKNISLVYLQVELDDF
ncbi:MAG: glyoxylase-like metal-dependent hydrolase (beta-lactamase superfamily II) [Methylophagaceae bacterium]|jgi:glyoxylase-like metal-dependent hydrolase (beta-lactamase superfamily II)